MNAFVSVEPGCLWLFGVLARQSTKDFQLLNSPLDFFRSFFNSSLYRWHRTRAGITLFSWLGCSGSPQKEMSNQCRWNEMKERIDTIVASLYIFSQCDDRWQPWYQVCMFVYCSSAKWPGTGTNRKRPCPQTNEQHYSNGAFVVSAVVWTLLSQAALLDAPFQSMHVGK